MAAEPVKEWFTQKAYIGREMEKASTAGSYFLSASQLGLDPLMEIFTVLSRVRIEPEAVA